ncbi:MAG: 3-deoxy-manno-octulosonate cytidylyltransferase [Mariprofundales bacterium]|nr:3-deoxy-manno-octulosonate cytidylyltransferase [Mariprofundales bacterium]
MKIIIGIPARYQSSRFPGKPLALLAGKPMIAHVVERARESALGRVIVATDDDRIADVATTAGAEVKMTTGEHHSGTDRLAAALAEEPCDVVVNLQGDEPLIDPAAIRAVVTPFASDATLTMATLARPATNEEIENPNVVKVVCDAKGHALYFSRAPIPYPRHSEHAQAWAHVGLYAYRKPFLLIYPKLARCDSEQTEGLEQLRVLHHGYPIAVVRGDFSAHGIDTPQEMAQAERILRK